MTDPHLDPADDAMFTAPDMSPYARFPDAYLTLGHAPTQAATTTGPLNSGGEPVVVAPLAPPEAASSSPVRQVTVGAPASIVATHDSAGGRSKVSRWSWRARFGWVLR